MIAGGSRTGADRLRRDRRKELSCRARASGRATPDLHRKPDKHPSASLQRDLHSGAGRGSLLDADNVPKGVPFARRLTICTSVAATAAMRVRHRSGMSSASFATECGRPNGRRSRAGFAAGCAARSILASAQTSTAVRYAANVRQRSLRRCQRHCGPAFTRRRPVSASRIGTLRLNASGSDWLIDRVRRPQL